MAKSSCHHLAPVARLLSLLREAAERDRSPREEGGMTIMIVIITIIITEKVGKMKGEEGGRGQGPTPMTEAIGTSALIATAARMTRIITPLAVATESVVGHQEITKPIGADPARKKGGPITTDRGKGNAAKSEVTVNMTTTNQATTQSAPPPLRSQPSPSNSWIAKRRTRRSRKGS